MTYPQLGWLILILIVLIINWVVFPITIVTLMGMIMLSGVGWFVYMLLLTHDNP